MRLRVLAEQDRRLYIGLEQKMGGAMLGPRRRKSDSPVHHEEVPAAGVWSWLQNRSNQKTLAFIGAGIAAAVALLLKVGVFDKPDMQKPPSAASSISSSAIAGSGGVAINVPGASNAVTVNKP